MGKYASGIDATWGAKAEITFVENLGMGIWAPGSDLRHSREWWLKKYIETAKYRVICLMWLLGWHGLRNF